RVLMPCSFVFFPCYAHLPYLRSFPTRRSSDLGFFKLLGLEEVRRMENERGRFTLYFLAAPGQQDIAEVELTWNWPPEDGNPAEQDRKSTRLNSSHVKISYAVFCLKKKIYNKLR